MRGILVPSTRHRKVPWRNGAGHSYQVWPRGSIASRSTFQVNLTPIESDGPFSLYPATDRVLVMLAGNELVLEPIGERLRPGDISRFPGETSIRASLGRGPVSVLNLLYLRSYWSANALMLEGESSISGAGHGDIGIVHAPTGGVTVTVGTSEVKLLQSDTFIIRCFKNMHISLRTGENKAVLFRLSPA